MEEKLIYDWLLAGMEKPGKTQQGLAKALGLSQPAVNEMLKRNRPPRIRELSMIAEYIEEELPIGGGMATGAISSIPVKGEIRAGAWVEIEEPDKAYNLESEGAPPSIPISPLPQFPTEAQYALLVRGDSMNKWVVEGEFVSCVELIASGIDLKDGHIVHVQRSRMGGHLVEATLERVRLIDGKCVLVPESTNDRWQPIDITGSEDEEITIRGIVTGKWQPALTL